jgi:hypothetical protein
MFFHYESEHGVLRQGKETTVTICKKKRKKKRNWKVQIRDWMVSPVKRKESRKLKKGIYFNILSSPSIRSTIESTLL